MKKKTKAEKSTWKWKTLSAIFSHSLSEFSRRLFLMLAGNEDITKNHKQEPKLSFLIKAIYTMAYGLQVGLEMWLRRGNNKNVSSQAYQEDVCGKYYVGICPQLHKSFNHSTFFVSQTVWTLPNFNDLNHSLTHQNYLLNVSFTTIEKDYVEFNQDGDVLAHYDIMNFQQMSNGSFSYVKIADWNNHTLNFIDDIKPPSTNGSEKFSSVCSRPCKSGEYKVG
jgi:hypothetical protein